jgi:hypothetical protein
VSNLVRRGRPGPDGAVRFLHRFGFPSESLTHWAGPWASPAGQPSAPARVPAAPRRRRRPGLAPSLPCAAGRAWLLLRLRRVGVAPARPSEIGGGDALADAAGVAWPPPGRWDRSSLSGTKFRSAFRPGVLSSQVSYRARTSCHGPCHVAAAVPWCLTGSDGHGAARVKDEDADPGNVPSGHHRDCFIPL